MNTKMSVERLQEIGRESRERHHTDPVPKEFADMPLLILEYWIEVATGRMKMLEELSRQTRTKEAVMSLKREILDFYIVREWLRTAELRLKREIAAAQDGGGDSDGGG